MSEKKTIEARKANIFAELTALNDSWKSRGKREEGKVMNLKRKLDILDQETRKLQNDVITFNAQVAATEFIATKDFVTFFVIIDNLYEAVFTLQKPVEAKSELVPSMTQDIPLPKIKLPVFSGEIEKWVEFQELFDTLVHTNTTLSPVQKLSYLRAQLKNEPLTLVASYGMHSDSYKDAYEALKKRYNSSRRLAHHYIKMLFKGHLSNKDVSFTLENIRAAITTLKKIDTKDLSDYLLFELTYNACEDSLQRSFDKAYKEESLPGTSDFLKHLENIARSQELRQDTKPIGKREEKVVKARAFVSIAGKPAENPSLVPFKTTTCVFCSGDHIVYLCDKFTALNADQRVEAIKRERLCFNCLGRHISKNCRSNSTCRKCQRRHHTFLHEGLNKPIQKEKENVVQTVASCLATSKKEILLATVRCRAKDAYGNTHYVTGLLDTGSQANLVTAEFVNRLELQKNCESKKMIGIANNSLKSLGSVQLTLYPHSTNEVNYVCCASIIPRICSQLPATSLYHKDFEQFKTLQLADPDFCTRKPVDLLLGAQAVAELMSSDQPNILPGEPTAMKTTFGWILFGTLTPPTQLKTDSVLLIEEEDNLSEELKKFWALEDCSNAQKEVDPEHTAIELHYKTTHTRLEDGTYCVRLPFKKNARPEKLNNREAAIRFEANLHRKLSRLGGEVDIRYNKFMQEMVDMQHMRLASQPVNYVLPHLLVHKESSSSTKTRAVFHASHKDSSGISINDLMLTGPKLQKDICDILMNFRFHEVAITADIKMMYRMIRIHDEDLKYQHIFWKSPTAIETQEYELLRVVYGMSPSSFLAQRTLVQLAKDEGSLFPRASQVLLNDVYMDDVVTGMSSTKEAINLREELTKLLMRGGFPLRKWSSSHAEVLEGLQSEHIEKLQEFDSGDSGIKILGLCWIPNTDQFSYQVKPFHGENTKRTILSLIAKLFDPIGFLQPVLILAKIFIQRLWLCQTGWDDPVPSTIASEWTQYSQLLPRLAAIRIPRYVGSSGCILRLVGFSDASENAYAAVLYVHVASPDEKFNAFILTAKSRVAPLKRQSIPRLELLGALLLSRLTKAVLENMGRHKFSSIHLYSDSAVTLAWIRTPPHNLKTYVSHRVLEIQENVHDVTWSYCPTNLNPADCASRGIWPDLLEEHPLWWHGPQFLKSDVASWPSGPPGGPTEIPEIKVPALVCSTEPIENDITIFFERISSLSKLQRVIAHVLRFIFNARNSRNRRRTGALSVNELREAMQTCIKLTQMKEFPQKTQKNINTSPLRKLSPFMDEEGILRVGGRLSRSSLPEKSKHPVLLSKSCYLSTLICQHYHQTMLHSGLLVTMTEIQRTYWILSLRSLVKKCIRKCIKCFRVNMKPGVTYMADLPPTRVTSSQVFKSVGTDFAGPVSTKTSTLRNAKQVKSYICLFICMATTACHIEVVSDLSSEAFLAAFNRFVARRGLPTDVYSDCGRNYVGAKGKLDEINQFLRVNSERILTNAAAQSTQWHFNPPLASHHGGLWEANIKTIKQLLYRQVGNMILTYEELATLLTRIEAVLNSRPLEFSSDPNDGVDYLTPGHFLVGRSLLAVPELPTTEDCTPRQRWERLRQIVQCLWSRWSKSYLNSLMQRNKWTKDVANISVGTLAYVQDLNTAPLLWPLGRVTAIHPGPDNRVRVVTIKVRDRELLRPITKVVPLPFSP